MHRHLPAVRLVSRHFPPLHEALRRFNSSAAPISRFVFAVRCVILSPMHAIWFRAEYRPSPSGASWRSLPHPAKSESLNLLSLFVSLCRAIRRVIPVPFLRRYRALMPRNARLAVQRWSFRHCLAIGKLFEQSLPSRLSLHIRRISRRYASQCVLASLRKMPGMRRSEAEGWM